jgi:hypothetical protein
LLLDIFIVFSPFDGCSELPLVHAGTRGLLPGGCRLFFILLTRRIFWVLSVSKSLERRGLLKSVIKIT